MVVQLTVSLYLEMKSGVDQWVTWSVWSGVCLAKTWLKVLMKTYRLQYYKYPKVCCSDDI
jgi:hypothetical protein